ncbi:Zn-dependent exopeptidase [Pisolithus sp. B1]|nr:Zn-dependent exopeptidase [Pisolithus sp. B1]
MILNPVTPVALLTILRASDVRPNIPPCLANNFYGIFGQQSVFKISDFACFDLLPASVDEGSKDGPQQLVWIQESSIDDSLRTPEYEVEVADFDAWLVSEKRVAYPDGQTILFEGAEPSPSSLVYRNANSGIVAVADQDAADVLSTRLPRFWKAMPIPASPVSYLPVPSAAVERVRDILRFAAEWLKAQFEDAGATCRFMQFLEGFAPNVVCRYDAKTESSNTVLISGHYDSRGSFGMERAPGGNDDGSGTISILNIARRIKQTGITFRSNVELVAFAGEEQGLLGSKGRELRGNGANITLMIQADMLAYHAPEEPPQLGLPQFIGTPEVAQLVASVSAIYSPELTVGLTTACCRYPATQVFERTGPIADPMYHNSGDFSDRPGYDLNQVRSISKVQFATLLHAAGFDLPEGVDLEDLERDD